MKKLFVFATFLVLFMTGTVLSDENKVADESSGDTVALKEIKVTAQNVKLSPNKTEVFMDDYNIAGQPTNVLDILKDRATIDFRGESDLVPESDSIQMRGFDVRPVPDISGWSGHPKDRWLVGDPLCGLRHDPPFPCGEH